MLAPEPDCKIHPIPSVVPDRCTRPSPQPGAPASTDAGSVDPSTKAARAAFGQSVNDWNCASQGVVGNAPELVIVQETSNWHRTPIQRWADEIRNTNRTRVLPPAIGLPYTECMRALERITITPDVRFGKPCVRGTRITVGDILGYLAGGMAEDQILAEFPQLSREDIRACLAYAAERERRTLGIPAA